MLSAAIVHESVECDHRGAKDQRRCDERARQTAAAMIPQVCSERRADRGADAGAPDEARECRAKAGIGISGRTVAARVRAAYKCSGQYSDTGAQNASNRGPCNGAVSLRKRRDGSH